MICINITTDPNYYNVLPKNVKLSPKKKTKSYSFDPKIYDHSDFKEMQSHIKTDYTNKVKSIYKKAWDLTIFLYEDYLSKESNTQLVNELYCIENI